MTVVRPWPPPQGQRKELLGPARKGSWPCMEENELYSSATAGEGLPLLLGRPPQGVVGRSCGPWLAASESSCPVAAPNPGQSPYQLLCLISGSGLRWLSLDCSGCQASSPTPTPVAHSLLPGP